MAVTYDALPHAGSGDNSSPTNNNINSNYDERFQNEQIEIRCADKYLHNTEDHFHVVVPIQHNFRLVWQMICYGILCLLAIATLTGILVHNHVRKGSSSSTSTSWMNQYWDQIQNKTILELTLPGSHNSGTYQNALSVQHDICTSDYRYNDYLKDPSTLSSSPLSQKEFDTQFIPWNINHDYSIEKQLDYGARYFHLKLCIMGDSRNDGEEGSSQLQDLSKVVHNHRGYTTQETLQDFIDTIQQFLDKNPKDIIVIGLNNIHFQQDTDDSNITEEQLMSLYTAISYAFGNDNTIGKNSIFISQQELLSTNLHDLVMEQGKRIVLFVKTTDTMDLAFLENTLQLIPSSKGLDENWDDAMSHGNLTAAEEWLYQDIVTHASSSSNSKNNNHTAPGKHKFYTVQANPNHADDIAVYPNMYSNMNTKGETTTPKALKEWETPLLLNLGDIVARARQQTQHLHINAISTDFFDVSQPLEIALRLMGISSSS